MAVLAEAMEDTEAHTAESGVLMGVKGFIPTQLTPKKNICRSTVIRYTIMEVGWDKSGMIWVKLQGGR